jgi:uncharacterized membrane protein YeaQ/YmgE (transglycosylase-associated protein family)
MDQLAGISGVSIGGTILIGIIAGWIAEKATGSDHGLLKNLLVGLVGSWIGFMISNAAGIQIAELVSGWFWGNLLVSSAGAVILLTVLKLFRGNKRQ